MYSQLLSVFLVAINSDALNILAFSFTKKLTDGCQNIFSKTSVINKILLRQRFKHFIEPIYVITLKIFQHFQEYHKGMSGEIPANLQVSDGIELSLSQVQSSLNL